MKFLFKLIIALFLVINTNAQSYQLFGDAFGVSPFNASCPSDTCFTLTPDLMNKRGAVYGDELFDLTRPFDGTFCLFLGTKDANGADGFAFILKDTNVSLIGGLGGGLGYSTLSPSIAIEFDTWNNGGVDIPADHTSLNFNGNVTSPIVPSISLSPTSANVEDGMSHTARIVWTPADTTLYMFFDNVLRFSHKVDLINRVFGGKTKVNWGFTSSTGGSSNLQQICFPVKPVSFYFDTLCQDSCLDFNQILYDPNYSYSWNNGVLDTFPLVTLCPNVATTYNLYKQSKLTGLIDTIELSIDVKTKPSLFLGRDTILCQDSSLFLSINKPMISYLWSTGDTSQTLLVDKRNEYWLQVTDSFGCKNTDTILVDIQKGKVELTADRQFGCEPLLVNFMERAIVYNGSVTGYYWDFGNSTNSFFPQDSTRYVTAGTYSVRLSVVSDLGCTFDSIYSDLIQVYPYAIANFDIGPSVGKENSQTYFNNLSINSTSWLWEFGDGSTSSLENPIKVFASSGKYSIKLKASNAGGCNDSIVKEFNVVKSPSFYAPNTFTPNYDGINDEWRVHGVEFASEYEIHIFNRWGEMLFSSMDKTESWNGIYNGKVVPEGIYSYRTIIKFDSDAYEYFGHILVGR